MQFKNDIMSYFLEAKKYKFSKLKILDLFRQI